MSEANRVVVATTVPAYVMDQEDTWGAWLYGAERLREVSAEEGYGVDFFAALETDGRGMTPFDPLIDRLDELGGSWWSFSLDDGATEITTANRLRRITMGQNLATDHCCTVGAHMLFMAADCQPPEDAIVELLALNHPLVGGHVPTYCLTGPIVSKYIPRYRDQIREHMASAAFILVRHDLLRFMRWRWDVVESMSDDPCFHHDALVFHGIPTYVHHGVVGRHYPECIGPIETRGHDMVRY